RRRTRDAGRGNDRGVGRRHLEADDQVIARGDGRRSNRRAGSRTGVRDRAGVTHGADDRRRHCRGAGRVRSEEQRVRGVESTTRTKAAVSQRQREGEGVGVGVGEGRERRIDSVDHAARVEDVVTRAVVEHGADAAVAGEADTRPLTSTRRLCDRADVDALVRLSTTGLVAGLNDRVARGQDRRGQRRHDRKSRVRVTELRGDADGRIGALESLQVTQRNARTISRGHRNGEDATLDHDDVTLQQARNRVGRYNSRGVEVEDDEGAANGAARRDRRRPAGRQGRTNAHFVPNGGRGTQVEVLRELRTVGEVQAQSHTGRTTEDQRVRVHLDSDVFTAFDDGGGAGNFRRRNAHGSLVNGRVGSSAGGAGANHVRGRAGRKT
ncbi:MAG: hypothetical protein ACK5QX_12310, partial [bacterium]